MRLNKKNITIIVALILFSIIAVDLYLYFDRLFNYEEPAPSGWQSFLPIFYSSNNRISADWLTYRNETWGLEFKYPETWEAREVSGILHFVDTATDSAYYIADVVRQPQSGTTTLEDWLRQDPNSQCLQRIKKIKVGGDNGLLVKNVCAIGNEYSEAIVLRGGYFFRIGYASFKTRRLEQIVSTIKFSSPKEKTAD